MSATCSGSQARTGAARLADMLEKAVLDFRDVLAREFEEIGTQLDETRAGAGERIKAYTGYFKMLQGVELMANGIRQQREIESGTELEVVEFRRQLEDAIARLVDAETTQDVSGGTE